MPSGYIYVLVHPSYPNLYKVGITTRTPEKRLAEHNKNYQEYAGQIVRETGKKWEIKTYLAVPDAVWAESAFWGATGLADMPYMRGIEVQTLDWKSIQAGLRAAEKAGVRPPPEPLPDWVYAYTAWMNKRLEGRDITLLSRVRSKYGRADFRCTNGHAWRTRPDLVAEGEGCPQCGIGKRDPDEIWKATRVGYLCLLVHPEKPGLVRIGLTHKKQDQWHEEDSWGDWEVHRYRHCDELELAETWIWKLLGRPKPDDCEPIEMDLSAAEEAVRSLHHEVQREIASRERAKDGGQTA